MYYLLFERAGQKQFTIDECPADRWVFAEGTYRESLEGISMVFPQVSGGTLVWSSFPIGSSYVFAPTFL